MKRNLWFCLFVLITAPIPVFSKDTLYLHSPNKNIRVKVWMEKQLLFSVSHRNQIIMGVSAIDLLLNNNRSLGSNNGIKKHSTHSVSETIVAPVPEKRKNIPDHYNQLNILFKQPYKVEFRAYDDGVAYRIITTFKDSITINNEVAEFNFPSDPEAYFPEIPYRKGAIDMFHTGFEDNYTYKPISEFPQQSLAYTPILIAPKQGPKIAVTESDLEDYPGLFVKGTGTHQLQSVFAAYPKEEKVLWEEYSQTQVTQRENFIARTVGARSFPWRVFMIAENDAQLPTNDLVFRLAAPSRLKDPSWIKPGNITDEWIIDLNIYNIPFKAGRNTDSYKYYIDFASRFGIEMVMLDAGWSDNNDLFKVVPQINMDTLVAYAKQKNVRLALWTLALTLDRQLDSALTQFNKWGIPFIMTDFINRDDQNAVQFHHRIAKACADHKIMVMFHGSYPPKGFNRTYPNAVAREGVLGSEYNIWSDRVSPDHDVLLPFTRMLAGSFDYEPGLLNNGTKKSFRSVEGHVMSPGTRAHQLSMYVVYDSPIQFFSGNPSQGFQEPAFMELLGSIPTTWDETIVTDAKVGEYIVTARRLGNNWYIAGMTNWNARDINLNFNFLEAGKTYKASICTDGLNADKYAADYIIEEKTITQKDQLKIRMAQGGGFLIKLE